MNCLEDKNRFGVLKRHVLIIMCSYHELQLAVLLSRGLPPDPLPKQTQLPNHVIMPSLSTTNLTPKASSPVSPQQRNLENNVSSLDQPSTSAFPSVDRNKSTADPVADRDA